MLKFARFLKQFKKEVLIGPVFKLTEAVFELIVPLVMAQIIDVGIANGDRGYVLRMGGDFRLFVSFIFCWRYDSSRYVHVIPPLFCGSELYDAV